MSYKLLVMDIDGTLTNSQKKVTEKTKSSILKIQQQGITVAIASGRPTPGIKAIADELELSRYGGFVLSYNGAKIINCQSNESVYNSVLPQEFLPEIYDFAVEHSLGIITYENSGIVSGNGVNKYVELEARITGLPIKEVDNFAQYVDFDVNKCLLSADGDYLATVEPVMKEKFGDRLNIFRSEPFFLEVMPQGIDKANSLKHLLQHLNLTKDEMICCGDGFNDLSMIQYAGLGVAMENAQQCVKDAADFITLSNDDDGVAYVIERFILS